MNYAFIHGNLLDGKEDMTVQSGVSLLVREEKIEAILPEGEPVPSGYEIVDLEGGYLLPGLINLHVHLASGGKPPKENAKPVDYKKLFSLLSGSRLVRYVLRKQGAGFAKDALMSGVTTIRAVGGILDLDGQNRDAVNSGKQIGPRILAANTGVSVPGGHFAGSLATEASSPEEAREHVRKIAATKPDLIKLMITGGVMDASEEGEPGVLRMPPEIVRAAAEEAHGLGLMVAAHVESPLGVKVALENGVDTIEHGAEPDEETIRLFKERGAACVCTISPALPYAEFTLEESHALPVAKKNGKIVMDGIIDCAKACLANGIPVGLGSDVGCPFITHYNFWRELYYFHKYCGVSEAFALYSATLGNAKILGLEKEIGSIEPGKKAEFILVRKNPLEDLTALRQMAMVYFRGKLFRDPVIRKDSGAEALLDRYM